MPGLRTPASLGSDASTFNVRVAGSTRLSIALDLAVEGLAGQRVGGGGDRLADGDVADGALRHVEGDRHRRHVVEGGDRLVEELTRSPTEISVRPMTPAKGALMVRLASSISALRRSISAFCCAVLASDRATAVTLLDFGELLGAASAASGAESSASVARVDARPSGRRRRGWTEDLARLHRSAGGEGDLGDDAGDLRIEDRLRGRQPPCRSRGSRRRSSIDLDRRGDDRASVRRRRPPPVRRPPGPPPFRARPPARHARQLPRPPRIMRRGCR